MKWKLKAILGAGLAIILATSMWGAYRWGYSAAEAAMAEAREKAIREAVAESQREQRELRARVRELSASLQESRREDARRMRQIETLREDYAAGAEQCFDEKGLEIFNAY